uniref:Proline rich 33 n=1 Tax=Cyclopterus lumpus TaxID=8103 RepID=A0A8C2X5K3_CYCLU
ILSLGAEALMAVAYGALAQPGLLFQHYPPPLLPKPGKDNVRLQKLLKRTAKKKASAQVLQPAALFRSCLSPVNEASPDLELSDHSTPPKTPEAPSGLYGVQQPLRFTVRPLYQHVASPYPQKTPTSEINTITTPTVEIQRATPTVEIQRATPTVEIQRATTPTVEIRGKTPTFEFQTLRASAGRSRTPAYHLSRATTPVFEVSKPNPLLFAVSPITVEPERSRTTKTVSAVGGLSASQSVKTVEPKPTETILNGDTHSEIPPAVKPIQQRITKSKSEPDLTRGTSPAGSQIPKTPTSELKTPVPLLKVIQKPKGVKSKVSGWSRLKKHMVVEQEVPIFPGIGSQKEAPGPDQSEVQKADEKAVDGPDARDENQTKDAPVAIEMNKSEEAKEELQKGESKEIPSFAHRLPVLLFSPKFDAKRLKEAALRPVTKISTVFEMGLIGRKGKEEEPKDFNRTARGFAAI